MDRDEHWKETRGDEKKGTVKFLRFICSIVDTIKLERTKLISVGLSHLQKNWKRIVF